MKRLTSLIKSALMGAACVATASVMAHDMVPGKAQTQPILLTNGTVFTISDGTKKDTDILIVDGKIAKVGQDLSASDAKVIDLAGQHVYPGLVALSTQLGLVEIGAVRSTRDLKEVSNTNPDVNARVAFNVDSEIIPTIRSNGVSYAQVYPDGNLLMGQSSIMNLDGWDFDDATVAASTGLHIKWPATRVSKGWWVSATPEQQKKAAMKKLKDLADYFGKAQAYFDAEKAGINRGKDSRWDAMIPVFEGERDVYIHANDERQIEQALMFSKLYNIKPIIVGGEDAWRMADELAAKQIEVIYTAPYGIPSRDKERYDQLYAAPAVMAKAGVPFAIAIDSTWPVRNLAFAAGNAVTFGLDKDQALKAITLDAAKIAGVDDKLGSIEPGKAATLVISKGDIMDFIGHDVKMMLIDGREVDLNNRHKQLYNKYKQR